MFKKPLILLLIFLFPSFLFSQQIPLSLNSFFKDKLFDNSIKTSFEVSSFLPVNSLVISMEDTVHFKNYSKRKLLQEHLFELKDSNYQLFLFPIFNFSIGQDQTNLVDQRLFRNTRGYYLAGNLLNKLSFVTTFYENQARYSLYETAYFLEHGELYSTESGIYQSQNAVIPGAARTKPFKENGFDFSYATGQIIYQPFKNLTISAGNAPQFIGVGYRSLLLSDNSLPAPHVRLKCTIKSKWELNYMRMRLMNLVRKPVSSSVEAYYEPKAFSVNYYTYNFSPSFSLSFFEGLVWSMGDSIQTKGVHPLFYSPIPFLAELTMNQQDLNSIIGLNVSYSGIKAQQFYGQIASGNLKNAFALQLGWRSYSCFGLKNSMLQFEYNQATEKMYQSVNSRLSYSNGNLPLAHTMGTAFQELIFRFNIDFKRFYFDLKTTYYHLNNYTSISLLPILKSKPLISTNLLFQVVELGYRFNKKTNFSAFIAWNYRSDQSNLLLPTNQFFLGLKTSLDNQYTDF